MIYLNAQELIAHLVQLGTRGDNPQPLTKHLTLFDAHRHEHYLSDLDGRDFSDAQFVEHLQRIFRRPRGGHLVCRMGQRPHIAGRSGKLTIVPDRVAIFVISSGKAAQLSPREVLIALGRATPGEAEQYGRPRWREQERKPQQQEAEAV